MSTGIESGILPKPTMSTESTELKSAKHNKRQISVSSKCWEVINASFTGAALGGFLGVGVGATVSYYLGNTVLYTCIGLTSGSIVGSVAIGKMVYMLNSGEFKKD